MQRTNNDYKISTQLFFILFKTNLLPQEVNV